MLTMPGSVHEDQYGDDMQPEADGPSFGLFSNDIAA